MKSVSSFSSIDEVCNIKYCPLMLYVDSSLRKSQVSLKCYRTYNYVIVLKIVDRCIMLILLGENDRFL